MTGHADSLDQAEPLSKPFWSSLILHGTVAGVLLASSWISGRQPVKWGDPNGGGFGAVDITSVSTIRLPSKDGPANPVANDTQSHAPEAPAKKKVVEKSKAPDPNAIALKTREKESKRKKYTETATAQPNSWRQQQQDQANQLYSKGGAAVSSPLYGIQGGGGLQIGNDSPFGTQFGAYAKIMRDRVAQNWRTSEFDSRREIPAAVVIFTIHRDGSVSNVKLTERSGNATLDISAQRAIMDAAPFPPLPPQFPRNEAQVELRFNLK